MHKSNRSVKFLLALLLLVPTTALSQSRSTIRMGLAGRNFSFLPFFAAEDLGFYKEEGFQQVEMIYLRSPVAIAALSSGEIQYTTHYGSVIRSAVKGFPLRVILSTTDTQLYSLVVRPEIKTVQDLKGKTLAISTAGQTDTYVAVTVLKKLGFDPGRNPKFVALGQEAAKVAAMERGIISGAFIQPPTSIVLKRKGYNILLHAGEYVELPVTGLATSLDWMQKNPQEVKAVLRSTYKGLRYVKEHRSEAVNLMMKYLSVEKDIAEQTYDTAVRYLSNTGVSSDQAIQAVIESSGEPAEKRLASNSVADFTLLREVIKEGRRP